MNLIKQSRWCMVISGLCAIHCLLMPVIAVLFPFIGMHTTEDRTIDYFFLIPGFVLAAVATMKSYIQVHRRAWIVFLTIFGFLLIFSAHFIFSHRAAYILSVLGVGMAMYGLYRNQLLLRSCTK